MLILVRPEVGFSKNLRENLRLQYPSLQLSSSLFASSSLRQRFTVLASHHAGTAQLEPLKDLDLGCI